MQRMVSLLLFFNETFLWHRFSGVIMGLLGTASLLLSSMSNQDHHIQGIWLLLSILIPLNYCINRLFVSHFKPKNSSPYRLAIGLFSCVAAISATAAILIGPLYIPLVNFNLGEVALLAHAVLMTILYIAFFTLAEHGALRNALSFYVAPLTGLFWGIVLFGEKIDYAFVFSALLIFSGLYLANKKSNHSPNKP